MYIYIYVYIYIHIYINTHTHTHIFIHTHTHISTHKRANLKREGSHQGSFFLVLVLRSRRTSTLAT